MSNKRYSKSQIEAMHEAMPELLYALGISNIEGNRKFRCLTPDHPDEHPSMNFWREKNLIHCHACGATADSITLAGWVSGETEFVKKVQALQSLTGKSFGDPNEPLTPSVQCLPERQKKRVIRPVPQKIEAEDVFDSVIYACEEVFQPQGWHARDYLHNRGFTDSEIKGYLLGWCKHPSDINPCWSSFPYNNSGYCVIPYCEPDNNKGSVVRTCTFRPLFASKTKEYKIKGQPSVLYQEHLLYRQADCEVYIVEGAFDAISLETIYGVSACAIGGAGGVNRLLSIVEHTDPQNRVPIVLQLDNDTAGKRMTATLARGLDEIGACYRIAPALPNGVKDANELLQRQRIRDR